MCKRFCKPKWPDLIWPLKGGVWKAPFPLQALIDDKDFNILNGLDLEMIISDDFEVIIRRGLLLWFGGLPAIYRSWHFGWKSVFSIRCGFVIRVGWSAVQIFVLVWDSCSNSCPPPPCCCIKRKKRATAEKAAEKCRKCRKCEKAAGKCGRLDPLTLPDDLVATELEISRKVNQLKPKDWLCNVIT